MATRSDLATTGLSLKPPAMVDEPAWSSGAGAGGVDPEPTQWPVLVTGAGGFVGGHTARYLAAAGHFVRGVTRRPVQVEPGDASIEWVVGDLTDSDIRRQALAGVRGVIHTAGWVSLGPDYKGISHSVNVEVTERLLSEAKAAGVERFVYTSTLYTLAAGTPE